jgi:hypothetical protein
MPRGVYPRKPGLTRNRSARSVEERFWEKVDKEAANDCWEWTGSRSKAGYGTFNLGRRGEGYALAHRFAYESLVGPIPEGLCLDHLCRNEGCVNPAHLEAVTPTENTRRGDAAWAIQTGKCDRGHARSVYGYTAPNGKTCCRLCRDLKRAGLAEQTERQFLRDVLTLARSLGWTAAHFRPARTEHGWRTPVEADGAGFPDLVLVRDRVVFLELKTERGKLSDQQKEWLRALDAAGAEAYVVRPRHLGLLSSVLRWPASALRRARDELRESTRQEIAA